MPLYESGVLGANFILGTKRLYVFTSKADRVPLVLVTAAPAVAVDPLVRYVADHAAQHMHHLAEAA